MVMTLFLQIAVYRCPSFSTAGRKDICALDYSFVGIYQSVSWSTWEGVGNESTSIG